MAVGGTPLTSEPSSDYARPQRWLQPPPQHSTHCLSASLPACLSPGVAIRCSICTVGASGKRKQTSPLLLSHRCLTLWLVASTGSFGSPDGRCLGDTFNCVSGSNGGCTSRLVGWRPKTVGHFVFLFFVSFFFTANRTKAQAFVLVVESQRTPEWL